MKLEEAVKSGRPFRHKDDDTWIILKNQFFPSDAYSIHSLISDDWEIQEASVTLTESQFENLIVRWNGYGNEPSDDEKLFCGWLRTVLFQEMAMKAAENG